MGVLEGGEPGGARFKDLINNLMSVSSFGKIVVWFSRTLLLEVHLECARAADAVSVRLREVVLAGVEGEDPVVVVVHHGLLFVVVPVDRAGHAGEVKDFLLLSRVHARGGEWGWVA